MNTKAKVRETLRHEAQRARNEVINWIIELRLLRARDPKKPSDAWNRHRNVEVKLAYWHKGYRVSWAAYVRSL